MSTRDDLTALINGQLPSNSVGGINALRLRTALLGLLADVYVKGDDAVGGGGGDGESTDAYLKSLPEDASALGDGDLYWNGDALFRNGAGSGTGSGGTIGGITVASLSDAPAFVKAILTGGGTAQAFLDLLYGSLPTTTPTTSGTWWLDAGVPTKTP